MKAKHVLAAALVLGGGAAAVWALRKKGLAAQPSPSSGEPRGAPLSGEPRGAPASAPEPPTPPQPPVFVSVDLEDWRRKLIEDLRQDLQAAIPKPQPEPAPAPSTVPQPVTSPVAEDWRTQLLEELKALIPKPQPAPEPEPEPEPVPAPSTAPQPSPPVVSQPEPTSTSTLDHAIAPTAPSCADELPRIREERARIWEEAAAVATGYSPSALYYDEATNTVRHVSDGRIVLNLPYWGPTSYIRGEVDKIWGCVNGACTTHYDLMSRYEPYRQRYLDTLKRERLCR